MLIAHWALWALARAMAPYHDAEFVDDISGFLEAQRNLNSPTLDWGVLPHQESTQTSEVPRSSTYVSVASAALEPPSNGSNDTVSSYIHVGAGVYLDVKKKKPEPEPEPCSSLLEEEERSKLKKILFFLPQSIPRENRTNATTVNIAPGLLLRHAPNTLAGLFTSDPQQLGIVHVEFEEDAGAKAVFGGAVAAAGRGGGAVRGGGGGASRGGRSRPRRNLSAGAAARPNDAVAVRPQWRLLLVSLYFAFQ